MGTNMMTATTIIEPKRIQRPILRCLLGGINVVIRLIDESKLYDADDAGDHEENQAVERGRAKSP